MSFTNIRKAAALTLAGAVLFGAVAGFPMSAKAEPIDYAAEAEARKGLPVQTDDIDNWPAGPRIGAGAAILMEANTGTILYAKNIKDKNYPASVTKIMTGLLAIENSELDETVTFSHEAVFSIERGSSNIGMDEGEAITMDQALHGMLILSANEVANAIGEHVGGDKDTFVQMMNDKAASLGCVNTHFCNANGLFNEDHYTCAYDLALIAREFFSYDVVASIARTPVCTFEATATQPDSFTLYTKNQLMKGMKYEYPYLVGSKTGYTSEARQTLVSCARKDGMELICVILKEESPCQFTDTVELFNYGFENFSKVNIADNEKSFTMNDSEFFDTGADIFGSSKALLSLSPDGYVILPKTADFSALTSELTYDDSESGSIATVHYSFNGTPVGQTDVILNAESADIFENKPAGGDTVTGEDETVVDIASVEPVEEESPVKDAGGATTNQTGDAVFINVKYIIFGLGGIVAVVVIVLIVRSILKDFYFAKKRRKIMQRKRNRSSKSEFDDL